MNKPQANDELIMEFADHAGEMGSCRVILVANPIEDGNDKRFCVHLSDNTGDEAFDDSWSYDTMKEAKAKFKMLVNTCML